MNALFIFIVFILQTRSLEAAQGPEVARPRARWRSIGHSLLSPDAELVITSQRECPSVGLFHGHKLLHIIDEALHILAVLADAAQLFLVEIRRQLFAQNDLTKHAAQIRRSRSVLIKTGHVQRSGINQSVAFAQFPGQKLRTAEEVDQVVLVHWNPIGDIAVYLRQKQLVGVLAVLDALAPETSNLLPHLGRILRLSDGDE